MKHRLQQNQKLKLSPKQIQFLGLLQIPITSIEHRIEEELEKNPALEEEIVEEEFQEEHHFYKRDNADFIPPPIPEKEQTLYENLRKQLLLLSLSEREHLLAEYLIGCLDEKGFLTRDLYTIESDLMLNQELEVSEIELEKILVIIQTLEPIGVGARDLQECLILQLKAKEQSDTVIAATDVLQYHYNSFSKKNFEAILKATDICEEMLKTVYQEVEKLNPNPGASYQNTYEPIRYILPDFSVTFNEGKLSLKLNKNNNRQVFVNKRYEKMLLESTDKATTDFLKQKIEAANWFAEAIKQRANTLYNVMSAILDLQQGYFSTGNEQDLKPMKLMDIAEVVQMDISTISRVSNSKYVETDFGTFLLKELFSEAYHKDDGTAISTNEIKSKLQEIIETEDKKIPLNDQQLALLLGEEEYHIARRTVAKYREQLKIPVARLRRKL